MKYCLTILTLFLFAHSAPYAQKTHFFDALPNVPIASHLTPLPDQASIFDKPAGRFIQVVGLIDKDTTTTSILTYYSSALPVFGWTKTNDTHYSRDGETLTLRFETYEGEEYLYLTVQP